MSARATAPVHVLVVDDSAVVRAAMHHQFVTPFMDHLFQMGPDMPGIVNAYVVVKNEPWAAS